MVTVTDIYGDVEADRLVIKRGGGVRRLRFEYKFNRADFADYPFLSGYELQTEFEGRATAKAVKISGIHGLITVERLARLFCSRSNRSNLVWKREHDHREPETLKRVFRGISLQPEYVNAEDICGTEWTIRDLSTGRIDFTCKVIDDQKIMITPGERCEVLSLNR